MGFGDPVLPQVLVIWQAAAALVLLIACINVANLILAQSAERGRELSLRLALGAGPARVARQLLTEGVLLAVAAAVLAMPLVGLAGRVLREMMPAEIARFVPGWDQLGADWRSLLFSVLVAIAAAFVFSAIPAWRAARLDLNATLREGGRSVTEGGRRQLGRSILGGRAAHGCARAARGRRRRRPQRSLRSSTVRRDTSRAACWRSRRRCRTRAIRRRASSASSRAR
jgi:hypothetical protein